MRMFAIAAGLGLISILLLPAAVPAQIYTPPVIPAVEPTTAAFDPVVAADVFANGFHVGEISHGV